MKRFALKRITALVLALVMTLSLLPMNVWATEGDTSPLATEQQTTEPAQLYMDKGSEGSPNYVTSHTASVSFITSNGGVDYLNLFFGDGESKTQINEETYTLDYPEGFGTFTFHDNGATVLWNPNGATEETGYIQATSKGNDSAYRMDLALILNSQDSDNNPFVYKDVEIYTVLDENGFGTYDSWGTHDGITKTTDEYGEHIEIPYTPGTVKTLFLKSLDNSVTLTKGEYGALLSHAELDDADVAKTGFYKLILKDTASGGGNVWVNFGENPGIDFMFTPQSSGNNQGGNVTLDGTQLYWYRDTWTADEFVTDRGRNFQFGIATDTNGALVPWVDTPTVVASSDGLGTFTPVNESGNVSIRWDATNVWDATGFITLTVGGVDYVLNVRTNVNRMGLEAQHNSFSTAIKLDQNTYEWKLYARQWDESIRDNVYVPVTADAFAIPDGSRLSWNTNGDKLLFDATGLTADSFPIDVFVTATGGYQQSFYFQVNYDDGVFRHNGVEVYTYLDPNTGKLGYVDSPTEDGLSLFNFYGHINFLFEKNVKNTLYLRPESNIKSMEIIGGKYPDRESWSEKNIIDLTPPSEGIDYYTLTLYEGMTESGDVYIRLLDAEGNRCGEISVIFEVPVTNPSAVQLWNYDGGWRLDGVKLDQGMGRQFIMSVGPQTNKTILNPDNCTIDVAGNIGMVSWDDLGRVMLDTANATDDHGLVKITMKDSGVSYYLAIQLVFQELLVWNGTDHIPFIDIPFIEGIGNEVLSLECYFRDYQNGHAITKITPWSEETQTGFQLTASAHADRFSWDWDTDNVLFDTNGLTVGDLPITLTAVNSDGRHYRLELSADSLNYYQTAYSTITVRLSNVQARVLSLDPVFNENGELVELKVKIKNELLTEDEKNAWRKMAEEDMHLAVGYEFNAKDTASETLPDVFHFCRFDTDGNLKVSDLHEEMWNIVKYEGEANMFEAYNAYGHTRSNGNFCAWASSNTGDLAILPSDSRDIYTWIFRYGTEGNYTYKEDGFVMKFEPEHPSLFNIEDALYPAVDEDRLTYVPHANLDTKLTITEYTEETQTFKYAEEGILTYEYQGDKTTYDTVIADITDTAALDGLSIDQWGVFWYDLLKVNAPIAGYMAKTVECSYYEEDVYGANEVTLRYHWRGSATDLKFTITWFDPATGAEYVEQIIVRMSTLPGSVKWMDRVATPMDAARVKFDEVPTSSGAENSYSNGVLWTEYADGTRVGDTTGGVMVDVDTVLAAELYFEAPAGATGFSAMYFGDGRDDATLNFNNGDLVESHKERLAQMESQNAFPLTNWGTEDNPCWGTEKTTLEGLLKQTYGVDDEIEYYYSANRGTRGYFVKWFFEDGTSLCEYVQLDTSPYVCEWKTPAVSPDAPSFGENVVPVEKPTVAFEGNINLVSRIHPQTKSGHFFFELDVVKEDGNAYIVQEGDKFTIILPYEFMGINPSTGKTWTYEDAIKMKSAKIQHFDDDFTLKENDGNLFGTFTERGIEFEVDSFSPFLLTWDAPGLYTNYQDGDLSGLIEMTSIGQAVGYPVGYEGSATTVYYLNPDLTELNYTRVEGNGSVNVTPVAGEDGLYSITLTDASGIVNVQMQEVRADGTSSSFPVIFSDGSEDNGSNGGGQNNYPPLFVYGQDQNGNYNYFNGTGFPVGGVQELSLYLGTYNEASGKFESFQAVSGDNVTIECSVADYNKYFSWSTETNKKNVLIFDTRSISVTGETQVQLLLTKGGETFKLDLFLHPGGNQGGPVELNGVQIFTGFTAGKFDYNDGDARPWVQSIPNGPTMAFIPMMPKSDYTPNVVKSVYLVTDKELNLLTNNGAVFGNATLTPTDITLDGGRKAYLLQVQGQSMDTEGDISLKIGDSDNMLLLHFRAQWNGQDMSCWKDYATPSGNSTVTVHLSPDQAQLITLPESINANNELIITVHNAAANNDAVWEALANRMQGFLVPFEYRSVEPVGMGKPQVKSIGTGYTIEKSLEMLEDEEYKFSNYYQGGGGVRMNGLFFAWSMEDAGRTIIVPTEESMTGAWIWRYEDNASVGGYTDKKDGVIVKFVLDENISNAVTMEKSDAEYVAKSQIEELNYPTLNPVIDFVRTNEVLSYTDGTLTYQYKGEKTNYNAVTAELRELAETHNSASYPKITLKDEQGGNILVYPLLNISAPAEGYRIKSVATEYNDNNYDDGASVVLWYDWWGPGSEVTYTLTWVDADTTDSANLADRVQQITIKTPALSSGEVWMDHINDGENHATPVPADRLILTELADGCGAQHVYTPGYLLTEFDNTNTNLDVKEILSSTIAVKAPDGAKGYRLVFSSDGNDDPTYNGNNAWAPKNFQENIEAADLVVLADGEIATKTEPLEDPLRKQVFGDIEYYYSADRGTRLMLLKWIYDLEDEDNEAGDANQDPTYEYIQMDTTPYYCTLKSTLSDVGDKEAVNKPMADVTDVPAGNIYLETRIHPQENKGGKYGQYFFELRLVDGAGNTYIDYHEDGYTIILPYSFMGEEWNYDMAENLKEKPIINHYDKNFNLKKDNGAITGEYTERGIEFRVDSFSPFMLTWTEDTKVPTTPVVTTSNDLTIAYGYQKQQISVKVKEEEKHTYTYQWYDAEGQAINGATSAEYILPENLSVGSYSYYCVVEATRAGNEEKASAKSNIISVAITKADATVTAPVAKELTYTGTAQELVTAGTTVGGTLQYSLDNVNYSTAIPTGKDAKTYTVYYKVVGDANHNDVAAKSVTVTISKAAVTVTADNKSKVYGESDPVLTYSASGLVGEENLNAISVTRVSGETVGEYVITATQTDGTNSNYAITFVDGTFTIAAKTSAPTIELSAETFTYDGTAREPTVTVKDGENVIPVSEYTVAYSDNIDAGTAKVTITDVAGGNYVVNGSKTFTIGKAPLTVTANAKTITYGAAPANAGVEYKGFVNGETEDVLTGTLSYSYNYKQYGDVGAYAITPAGLSSDNYAITFVNGTLTVEQKEIGIKWSNTDLTYSGKAQAPTATATGMVNGDEVMLTVSGEQTNASAEAYTATVTAVSNSNYKLPAAVTTQFTIAKAQPSYTVPANLTATYGQTLADVKLPAGWAWVDAATTSVGAVGSNKFAVEFTPADIVNYNKVSGTATITVNKQQIAKPDADNTKFVYTGVVQTYTVAASELYTVSGNTRIEAGSQTVTIALTDKENYAWVGGSSDDLQYTFTIAKATQAAPVVVGVNETVFAKNDGKITDVTNAMEYSVDGSTYTAITDGKLENLAPATYYVRYAETENRLASDVVTVVIAAGKKVTVTFAVNGGNAIEAIKDLAYGDKVTAPTEPKKAGYTFAGWFSDEVCTKAWNFDKDTVSADVTLYAKWNSIPVVYPPYVPETPSTTPVEKPTETKPTTPTQPTTPPAEVTVPVSGDENTINVEASVSGSTATIDKVDMTKLEGVIGDDVAVGTVTIDFSDLESSETIDTVEIPADVVKEIAEAVADPNNDAESLEIVLSDDASIEFDAAALAEKVSQAGGADITISIKRAVETILSAAQQAAVGDRVAFDINVTSGGVHISDMGGKITIHAPYELRDGETAEGIVVYYVDDEGNKEKCETSYDSVKKCVNWKTDHLSVYMIAHDAPTTDDAPAVDNAPADDATQNDSGNSVGLWIGVALAVLVVAIIVVVILIKRKKA